MSSSAEVTAGEARQRHGVAQPVSSTDDASRGVEDVELPVHGQDTKPMKTYGKTPDGTGKELHLLHFAPSRTNSIGM